MPSLPWTATDFIYDGKSINEIETDTLYDGCFMLTNMAIIFVCVPVWFYILALKKECKGMIGYLSDEIITLDDGEMCSGYRGKDKDSIREYYIETIKYGDIRKLVLNKYYERIYIYCDMSLIVYSDYRNDVVDYTEVCKEDKIIIDLYYENSEDFIKTLEEKSGIKVQVIDEVDESYNRVD